MADGPITTIVGNPQAGSRTATLATLVAERLASWAGDDRQPATIDLATVGAGLLAWGDPQVAELTATVKQARALVVATPTYKASFTGLVKLFLDQFGKDELAGVPTVAVMTGGSPAHSLAVEVHLKPVLVEIGASLPTAGLYVAGSAIDDPTATIDAWATLAEPALRRALA